MSIQCLVIVNGYTEGKFDANRARFAVLFDVVPNVGDTILLEPNPTWGKIWCVVEHRYVGSRFVYIGARVATHDDHVNAFKNYGLDLSGV